MLDGALPAFPNLFIPIVDVRDVARAHILAMTNPSVAGERFLLSNGRPLPMKEIGAIVKTDLGDAAKCVPTRSIPSVVLRAMSFFNAELRPFAPDLGEENLQRKGPTGT
jgi:nucleoside-diphosphate-sugar epimerase